MNVKMVVKINFMEKIKMVDVGIEARELGGQGGGTPFARREAACDPLKPLRLGKIIFLYPLGKIEFFIPPSVDPTRAHLYEDQATMWKRRRIKIKFRFRGFVASESKFPSFIRYSNNFLFG